MAHSCHPPSAQVSRRSGCCPAMAGQGRDLSTDSFPSIFAHDHHAIVPLMLLSKLLKQYDAQQQASRSSLRTQTQFSVPPTYSVNVVLLLPKTSPHCGMVRSSTGIPYTTTATLDQALRASRHFWQEPPLAHDPQWESLLSSYSTQCDPFPPCPPPLLHLTLSCSYHLPRLRPWS